MESNEGPLMSFLGLPNEIILHISEEPSLSVSDLNSLVRTNRRLASLLQNAPTEALFRARSWEPGKRLLCYAADRGDYFTVKKLLDRGILDFSPSTPILHDAVVTQSVRAVRTLLECGVNADSRNLHRQTPLLLAVRYGLVEVVELLLAQPEVNVNACDAQEGPPLFVAAALGDEKIACLLLGNPGADLLICNYRGVTPLAMAAHMGHEGMVKILLDKTPEVNLCPGGSTTPLIAAVHSGHVNIVNLLLQDIRVDPNARDFSSSTPMEYTVSMHFEIGRRPKGRTHMRIPSLDIYGPLGKKRPKTIITLKELGEMGEILLKAIRANQGSNGLRTMLEQCDTDRNAVTPRNPTA